MLTVLLSHFVPNYTQTQDPQVRQKIGIFAGGIGIVLNLLLFLGKLMAGIFTGAISITADAFNNLSDAASSVVTLAGFHLAGQQADADHPFGHGRMEYLAGLIVSLLILLVGVELGKSSLDKILHPTETAFTYLSAAILLVSIAVKLGMGWMNTHLGNLIDSDTLHATATDSRSDALATGVVLLGLVVSHFTHVVLDGWLGLLVTVVILKAGWSAAKDTLDPLLGAPPDPLMVKDIEHLILEHSQVVGIHDLIIHDYGPGRRMMSVHAEVSDQADMVEIHDIIDHIERELAERFQIEAVIHMDPIQTNNPLVDELRTTTTAMAKAIHPALTIHDFRITHGPLHTNLIFDVVVPYSVDIPVETVTNTLQHQLMALDPSYHTVIQVDRSYV